MHSLGEALDLARSRGETELFIGGGSEVYSESLPAASRIYLTAVDADVEADTFFPKFDLDEWDESGGELHLADDRHSLPFSFKILNRKTT